MIITSSHSSLSENLKLPQTIYDQNLSTITPLLERSLVDTNYTVFQRREYLGALFAERLDGIFGRLQRDEPVGKREVLAIKTICQDPDFDFTASSRGTGLPALLLILDSCGDSPDLVPIKSSLQN